ncbi:uncharacterized protein TrAtP1_004594 [Trichoderma atroviride]|uniref:uncharacterized protein n=1 Tax=Hypocrea atroviridis TaxID=63577 RepID=UPI003324E548|nr:hypothetical protein TrAtP1_004594 [Trichoderma atroviride]
MPGFGASREQAAKSYFVLKMNDIVGFTLSRPGYIIPAPQLVVTVIPPSDTG